MDKMSPIVRIYDAEPAKLLLAYIAVTGELPLWLTAQAAAGPVP
jgi:hypothetical protein